MFSKVRLIFLSSVISVALSTLLAGCGGEDSEVTPPPTQDMLEILALEGDNPYTARMDSAPDDGCIRFRVKPLGPLRKVFNDSNHVHLAAAREIGIKPVHTDADILALKRPLVKIASCPQYYLDNLTHSFPYLVPEAATLLHDIGQAFNDSLAARGGGNYRMKVTSLLRTPVTVKKLRRVNVNATSESTHNFGTTFDISYSKFIYDGPGAPSRTFEDLKNLLAEVLDDMRRAGRCYIKFEYKQSCFHITARPVTN